MIWLVENTRGFFTAFFCLTTAFPSSLVVSLQHCQQSPKQRPSTEETARTPADLVSALQSAQKRHRWKIQTLKYANYYVLLQISRYGKKNKIKKNQTQCLASEDTVSHLWLTLVNLLRSVQPHPLSVTSLRLGVLVPFCLLICLSCRSCRLPEENTYDFCIISFPWRIFISADRKPLKLVSAKQNKTEQSN